MRSVSCDFYLKAMCVSRLCSFQSWDYSHLQGDRGAPQPLPKATFRKLACLLLSFALIFGEIYLLVLNEVKECCDWMSP